MSRVRIWDGPTSLRPPPPPTFMLYWRRWSRHRHCVGDSAWPLFFGVRVSWVCVLCACNAATDSSFASSARSSRRSAPVDAEDRAAPSATETDGPSHRAAAFGHFRSRTLHTRRTHTHTDTHTHVHTDTTELVGRPTKQNGGQRWWTTSPLRSVSKLLQQDRQQTR